MADQFKDFEHLHGKEKADEARIVHGLPVEGYRPQNDTNVALVNRNKIREEEVLRVLDELATVDGVDKRWLAIGRTAIENGFMAVNRSIFKPGRANLSTLPL
jgi:hypothetical protein